MPKEHPCFEFVWKIENFTKNVQRVGEYIDSPYFVVDSLGGSAWCVSICPKEENRKEFIGFYLARETAVGPKKITIDYELSFLSYDGSPPLVHALKRHYFFNEHSYGTDEFVERDSLFNGSKKSQFLANDTLTACCRIWKIEECTPKEHQKCFARTRIGYEKQNFCWKISNINDLRENQTKEITIHFKPELEHSLIMKLRLKQQLLNISISQRNTSKTNVITSRISRSWQSGKEYKRWFDVRSGEQTWDVPFSELVSLKQSSKPVILYCECAISTGVTENQIGNTYENVFIQRIYISDSSETEESTLNKQNENEAGNFASLTNPNIQSDPRINQERQFPGNCFTLKDGINLMYQEGILCDLKLIVGTKTFHVHKTVLSARSTVFRARSGSKYMKLPEISYQTVARMLSFMYTDTVEDVDWEGATDLYTTAVKYNVLPLQQKCASILSTNLCFSNACAILCLSDLHKNDALKSKVQNFIFQHDTEIISSDIWKTFEEQNTKLAIETMRNYILQKAKPNQFVVSEQKSVDTSSTLKADVYDLYKDKTLCDYTLETKEESFLVHKVVLGARSPVFRSMIECSMKEAASQSVFIEDLSADTVRKMVTFMYTDTVENVEFDSASELYFAADKYDIQSLKEVCTSIMIKNLSVSNVCETLAIADLHQGVGLKSIVIDYIFKHDAEIIPSELWSELQSSNYRLASETMRELYLKKLAS